ncbi:MAG: peptide ABC transporter substrate-binding protein [Verrucomicrobia subdivision 3 bacterium]|nr:peptide ABC transporter substrate-binding protein [Limisphaerales bacterium]
MIFSRNALWSSRRAFRFCLILLVSLAAGCTRYARRADLVIVNGPEPESLDPAIITGQADGRIALTLFEGLTRYNPTDATPLPGLAERWDISPDGRTYTFYIRTKAVWSTGEPITAHDFVYSWRRVLDPLTGADYAGQLYYVKGAEDYNTGKHKDPGQIGVSAVNDKTLRVELVDPTPFFLDLCAFQTLAPVPRNVIEKHGDRWLMAKPLPVTGAYTLVSWRINDRVRLQKNPLYWDAANTHCEVVDLIPCTVATTALNLYETGQADIVWDKELVPVELLDKLQKRPDFHTYNYLGSYFYRYNLNRKPFDDVRVRKAMALAVDKKRLVEKITRAGEQVASHLVPPGVANYKSPEGLGYDPDLARKLLKEAGYEGGKGFPRVDYMFNSVKTHEKIAVELQEMWARELGIQIELRNLEWKVFLQAQSRLEFGLSRSSWIGDYNDPNTFLDMFMSNNGNNRTGWKNQRYDELIRQANSKFDPNEREKTLQKAEILLVREEVPIVPLFFYVGQELYDTARFSGIYPNIRAEHPIRTIRVHKQPLEQTSLTGKLAANDHAR